MIFKTKKEFDRNVLRNINHYVNQKDFGKIYRRDKNISFSDEPSVLYSYSIFSFPLLFLTIFKLKNKIKNLKIEIAYNNNIIDRYQEKINNDFRNLTKIEIEKYCEAIAMNIILEREIKLLKLELRTPMLIFLGLNN